MNGTASTKENPGVRRELSERPTPDMLRRTDSMTAFHAQKEFQDRTVSIGNDEREYFVSGCLLLLDCARGDLERRRRRSDCPGRPRPVRAHDEVEESAAGFDTIAEARREEAAVSCSNAELLPAPGGRQSCAARPAAVHGQLQVYHLLSSESYLLPLPCSNVSYFIRQSTGQRRHGQADRRLRQIHDVRQQHGDGHGPDAARHGRDGRDDLGRFVEMDVTH